MWSTPDTPKCFYLQELSLLYQMNSDALDALKPDGVAGGPDPWGNLGLRVLRFGGLRLHV